MSMSPSDIRAAAACVAEARLHRLSKEDITVRSAACACWISLTHPLGSEGFGAIG